MIKDTHSGYGLLSIAVHWLSALLVLSLFGLGIYMTGLGYYDTWYHKGPALHISLGLILALLLLVRVGWRLLNPTPVALGQQALQRLAARLAKWALYLSMFTLIISGYLITTAEGKPASLFDWLYVPALLELNPSQVDLAGEIHEYLAWGLMALVFMHVAGALFHHWVLRDRTLVRMLKPGPK